jgi:hypothetical protein
MPSYSTNLNLAKPTVGGDTNQWGGYLNTNTDTLDAIFNGAGTGTSVGLQVGFGKTLKVGGTLTATGVVQLTGSQNELRFFEAIGGADNYVALKAPNEMSGNNNYSLVLPAAQGTAGQFLKLSSLSGSEGLLTFADAGGQADNYFASSGLLNKDLGVGLHLKIADTGASVSSNADELVIENTSDAGLSILTLSSGGAINLVGGGSTIFTANTSTAKFNHSGTYDVRSFGFVGNGTGAGWKILRDSNQGTMFIETHFGTTRTLINFVNTNGTVGGISTSGSSTAYNTSSDYRLKENVEYSFDAIERLKELKPARFNFIADSNKTVDGFIAHEVQEIVPEAITGEKDGEEMQAIDQAKLVPLITKALQEAITKIESLESEIDQLKGVN